MRYAQAALPCLKPISGRYPLFPCSHSLRIYYLLNRPPGAESHTVLLTDIPGARAGEGKGGSEPLSCLGGLDRTLAGLAGLLPLADPLCTRHSHDGLSVDPFQPNICRHCLRHVAPPYRQHPAALPAPP